VGVEFRGSPPEVDKCLQLNNAEHMQRITKPPGHIQPIETARRAAVLTSISHSWTALANQLDNLAIIVKSEG